MSSKRTPKPTNVAPMAKRLTRLRRELDRTQEALKTARELAHYWVETSAQYEKKLEDICSTTSKVREALLSYPDRLPRSCSGWGEGNYTYLVECIRAELAYWASTLKHGGGGGGGGAPPPLGSTPLVPGPSQPFQVLHQGFHPHSQVVGHLHQQRGGRVAVATQQVSNGPLGDSQFTGHPGAGSAGSLEGLDLGFYTSNTHTFMRT
jgi:hypothetical protein